MQQIGQHKQYFKTVLDNLMKQPFVEKHVKQPFIDEDKLQLSYFLFEDQSKAWESFEQYITATALIQMAIDMHERIPVENEPDLEEVEKQLTVLVGDYFSGMYYYILSKLEDIEMIRIVAQSIKGINEAKMNVYYNHISSLNGFIQSLITVESDFYKELLRYENKIKWIPIVEQYLLANRLQKEKELLVKGDSTKFRQAVGIYVEKNEMTINLYDWLEEEYDQAKTTLLELLDDKELIETAWGKWMVECHQPLAKTIAVKEGLR